MYRDGNQYSHIDPLNYTGRGIHYGKQLQFASYYVHECAILLFMDAILYTVGYALYPYLIARCILYMDSLDSRTFECYNQSSGQGTHTIRAQLVCSFTLKTGPPPKRQVLFSRSNNLGQ